MVAFDPIFVIDAYSHYFRVTRIQTQGRILVDQFLAKYIHEAFKVPSASRYVNKNEPRDKVYGFTTKNLLEYRFHLGQLEPFKRMMRDRGVDESFYVVQHHILPIPVGIKAEVKEGWVLRDRQPKVLDFIITPIEGDMRSRLVTLPTGQGKTIIGLIAMIKRRYRVAIIVLPSYIEKWTQDIKDVTTATDKDIMVVQGSDSLRGLIELGKTGEYKSDFVLISTRTWTDFIKAYAEDPRDTMEGNYGCQPDQLFELLGIGSILIDEIHQHFYSVYLTFCFMHVDLTVGLSATFLSPDGFIDNMQRVMFPREIRFDEIKMEKYIRAYAISYNLNADRAKNVKTSERNSLMYSQSAFEKSIIKNRELLHNYLKILEEVFRNGFMDQYEKGHKCIIFVRTVKMATIMVEHLQKLYPQLDTRRYVEQDPYENVIEADIRVTTQQSAGTAVDIKGLMTNITMDNMRSPVATLQCFGRLRKPNKGVARYFTVYCENIKRHVQYNMEKRDILSDRVLSWKEFKSNVSL